MTPTEFSGAWHRQGLRVGGGTMQEPGVVVWVQVGDSYADIRTPHAPGILSGPSAFAGTTSYADDALTWHHEIDCPPLVATDEPPQDVGHVTWAGNDLIERGSFTVDGVETRYEERWCRLPGDSADPMMVFTPTTGSGIAVRAGEHLVAVVADGTALHLHCRHGEWMAESELGHPERCHELHRSILRALDVVAPLTPSTNRPTMEWKVNVPHTLSS